MKMTNILVAAICIPLLMSCGEAPQEKQAEPIKIKPNVSMEHRVKQEPIRKRVFDKMAKWCEDERAYIEREMSSAEAQESEKYRHYLRLKYKTLMEKCEKRYKK